MNRLTCCLLFLLLPLAGFSQNISLEGLQFGVEGLRGTTFLHSPNMRFSIPDQPWGLDLEAMCQTQGSRAWHQVFNYPRFGIGLKFRSFGNDPILGYTLGLVPQIDFPLKRNQHWSLWWRFGFGASFITRPYDRFDNPTNTAIGSRFNNLTILGAFGEWHLNPRFRLRLGGVLTHTSNGGVKMPNLGINTGKLLLGLVYRVDTLDARRSSELRFRPFQQQIVWNVRAGLGGEQLIAAHGPSYPIYILQLYASRFLGRGSKLNLGMEYNYYSSLDAFNRNLDPDVIPNNFDPSRFSLTLGHELVFGQVSFLVSMFMYVDHPFEGGQWWGNKLGPMIYLHDPSEPGRRRNIFIAGYLKSHTYIADYVELSLGMSF
jgi:hypothetical protein